MTLIIADRVQETTLTTGTSSYALLGAKTGFQSFGAVMADADTTYYAVTDGTDWEVGIGTYSTTGPTMARTTILASSNGGAAVSWATGTKEIFLTYAAEKSVYLDETGDLSVDGTTFFVDAVNNFVGIGTAVPAVKLNISNGATTGTALQVETAGAGHNIDMVDATGTARVRNVNGEMRLYGDLNTGGNGNIIFLPQGTTERMRIDSSGNVGIGTSSPTENLHVSSSGFTQIKVESTGAAADPELALTNDNGGASEWTLRLDKSDSDKFQLRYNNSDILTAITSGNVGIGTVSPTGLMHLYGSATAGANTVLRVQNGNNDGIGFLTFGDVDDVFIGGVQYNHTDDSMGFYVNNAYRMYITSAGNVGVGYAPAAAKFGVTSTGTSAWDYVNVQNTTSGAYTGIGFDGDDATSNFTINRNGTGGTNIAISSAGHVYLNPDADSVGIGLPLTDTPATKLHVLGNALIESDDAGSAAGPLFFLRRTSASPADNDYLGEVRFQGTNSVADNSVNYARIIAQATDVTDATEDGALTFWTMGAGTSAERARIDSGGNIFVGATSLSTTSSTDTCVELTSSGSGYFYRSSGTAVVACRQTNDGIVISIRQAGVEEGNISVSGTTVSYNGGHLSRWAQLPDNSRPELLKGTVMSNLDQMSNWDGEDNEQLNCVQVSTVEGDANVAGVFVAWDSADDGYNDILLGMTGDMVIRIGAGVTVARGDLLMSAGDGTAKPQGDDIVRSKTIAKVTSTHVSHTYEDGSYAVPCVLMAC